MRFGHHNAGANWALCAATTNQALFLRAEHAASVFASLAQPAGSSAGAGADATPAAGSQASSGGSAHAGDDMSKRHHGSSDPEDAPPGKASRPAEASELAATTPGPELLPAFYLSRPQPQRPTHFVALRVTSAAVLAAVDSVQQKLRAHNPKLAATCVPVVRAQPLPRPTPLLGAPITRHHVWNHSSQFRLVARSLLLSCDSRTPPGPRRPQAKSHLTLQVFSAPQDGVGHAGALAAAEAALRRAAAAEASRAVRPCFSGLSSFRSQARKRAGA